MTAYNVLNRTDMAAGMPEDISDVVANLDAIAAVINGSIDNSNLSTSAAIAKSKLAALAIVNADVDAAAAIAVTKLAASANVGDVLKTVTGPAVAWGAGGPTVTIATTPPGTPSTGDIWIYVDSTTVPTVALQFTYDSTITDANKWVFTGGAPLAAAAAGVTTTSTTYANLSTDIAVTIPRSGIYTVMMAGSHAYQGGGQVEAIAVKFGAAATADADSGNPTLVANRASGPRIFPSKTLVAADVVRIQAKTSAGTLTCSQGLTVTPVRVA